MLEKIRTWLNNESIDFKEVHHQVTTTSEESANARGEDIRIGGKALILKIDDSFKIFVLSAAKKLNSLAIKKHFGAKKIRFASKDELLELTGLVPGSVPPFGKPLFELDLFVDNSILENDKIAFNAGSLTDSIVMKRADYINLAKPTLLSFSE